MAPGSCIYLHLSYLQCTWCRTHRPVCFGARGPVHPLLSVVSYQTTTFGARGPVTRPAQRQTGGLAWLPVSHRRRLIVTKSIKGEHGLDCGQPMPLGAGPQGLVEPKIVASGYRRPLVLSHKVWRIRLRKPQYHKYVIPQYRQKFGQEEAIVRVAGPGHGERPRTERRWESALPKTSIRSIRKVPQGGILALPQPQDGNWLYKKLSRTHPPVFPCVLTETRI